MTPLQSVERELAANAASLRALAQDLVGRDAADDLVQETALRALRSPPARPFGLGAWLATILRRLAGTHRRAERRRSAREATAASAEPVLAADETIARRESLRAVTSVLLALPEPYQTTLLLRYFEDLTPAAIATRTRTPLPTVKSRLQRGLMLLREQMERRDRSGRWRTALALATGLPAPAPLLLTTGTLTGALLMANTMKFSIAAALVLGAVAFWQMGNASNAPPPANARATRSEPVATAAPVATLPREPAAERSVVRDDPFPGVDLQHPFAFSVRCKVIDELGLPVEGARIALNPLGGADNVWPDTTDAAGVVTLRWRSRTATQRMALRVGDGIPRELIVQAGAETGIVLLGEKATALALGLRISGDFPVDVSDPGVRFLRATPTLLDANGTDLAPRLGMHPETTFCDQLIGARGGDRTAWLLNDLPLIGTVFRLSSVTTVDSPGVSLDDSVVETIGVSTDPPAERGAIAGTVFGEDGEPAANVVVCCCVQSDQPIARAQSSGDGTFHLDDLPPGPLEVRAGGGPEGLARASTLVGARGKTPVTMQLRRERTIRGTAFGEDHRPLAQWHVDYEALDGTWADRTQVADDGSFVLANLPSQPGRVWLHADTKALAAALLPSVLPDSGPVAFDLGDGAGIGGGLHLRLPEAARPGDGSDRTPPRPVTVRAWQLDTQLATTLQANDDGAFAQAGLSASFYRVEVLATEISWSDLGTHFVDGKGPLELGTVALPLPGTLRIVGRPERAAIELYHRRPHGDVRALHDLGVEPGDVLLPVGQWLLFWRVGDREPQVREFTLRSGAVTELDLGS